MTYGATLGPHPLLLGALERRLAEAGPAARDPARTGVVLAAAGSSDPDANAAIARLAARWQARTGWFAVRPAYAAAAEPSPAAAVTGLLRAGARRVVVATYLLAPGFFADRIREPHWPRARRRYPPRSALRPRWPTSCWTGCPRREQRRTAAKSGA